MKAGIDHFTREQFEDALPKHKKTGESLWACAGLVDGEYEYYVIVGTVNDKVQIEIRSSVGPNGRSANTGENSIRAYLTWFDKDTGTWKPLGSKVQKYVTRLPGWQNRLADMLRTLYRWRLLAGNCPKCGKPKGIFKSKTDANPGRVYAKCLQHNHFEWIEKAGK